MVTPTLSDAEAVTEVVPLTCAPASGAVIAVVGGVVSPPPLESSIVKLRGNPDMVGLYDVIGIGQWFRYVTGLLELTGAILVVIPWTEFFGAALLSTVMIGAVLTHLFILHSAPTAPAVLFLLAGIVAWGRRAALKPALSRLGLVTS